MQRPCGPVPLGSFLALCFYAGAGRALAVTPSFAISATNVTMPLSQGSCNSSGCTWQYGSSTFTLSSVDGYTGAPQISCAVANPPFGASLPTCFQHGPMPTLPANGTINGEILFIAPGQTPPPSPAGLSRRKDRAAGVLLAAALLFGMGLRRRGARWFTPVLLALGIFGASSVISACGGSGSSMTPGTYSYTVSAMDANGDSASTTINVTIP